MHDAALYHERSLRCDRALQIAFSYSQGTLVEDICDEFICSRNTVLRIARLFHLPKRPKGRGAEVRKMVIRAYKQKKPKIPVETIAKTYKVSPAYVSKLAREEGISRYK